MCVSFFLLEWPKVPVQETGPPPMGVFGEGKEGVYWETMILYTMVE